LQWLPCVVAVLLLLWLVVGSFVFVCGCFFFPFPNGENLPKPDGGGKKERK
jgi:hypothetical protein